MNVRKPVIPLSKADAQLMQRSAGLVRSHMIMISVPTKPKSN